MNNDDIDNDMDMEDFDTDGFDDGGFDDFNEQKGTLGDLWRNNSLVKIGVILAAFAFLVGGIILFGGESKKDATSRVASSRDLTEAPGSSEVSQAYREAVEEENVRRTESEIRQGGSAMPTPIDPPKGSVALQFEEPEEEDPLERWRRLQEKRITQEQLQIENQPQAEPEPEVDTRTPAVNALAAALSQQMQSVLSNQQILGPSIQNVATITYLEGIQDRERQKREQALADAREQQATLTNAVAGDGLDILLPAGTIEYAQLLTEANSDVPGPVLAQVVSGPLKDSRLIGSFSVGTGYLILNFNTIIIDGIDYSVSAVAIDPETTLPGVITSVDQRYFRRVILPGAAAFIEGLAEAISDSETTTITINGADGTTTTNTTGAIDNDQEVASGIEEVGEELAEILDDMADDTEPLLRVRSGTPIGVLFTASVTGTPQVLQQQQQQDQQFQLQQLQLQQGISSVVNGANDNNASQ